MKTDARVRYTLMKLKESFLVLLEKKPINKITVKEVCELSELNRATFYTHFTDCYDLLESIENELIDDFKKSLQYVNSFDVTHLVSAIYEMIERNENVCRVLVFENANASVIKKMITIAHDQSIHSWRKLLTKASDSELEMLYTHLSNGLMHVVTEGYQCRDKTEVIAFVNRIVQSSMAAFK